MIVLAPLAVVAFTGAAYWAFLLRVKQLLEERHPDVWESLRSKRWWNDFSVAQRFAWSKRALALGDAELAKNARLFRATSLVAYGLTAVWAVYVVRGMNR